MLNETVKKWYCIRDVHIMSMYTNKILFTNNLNTQCIMNIMGDEAKMQQLPRTQDGTLITPWNQRDHIKIYGMSWADPDLFLRWPQWISSKQTNRKKRKTDKKQPQSIFNWLKKSKDDLGRNWTWRAENQNKYHNYWLLIQQFRQVAALLFTCIKIGR